MRQLLILIVIFSGCQDANASDRQGTVPHGYQQRAFDDVIYHVFVADAGDISLHQKNSKGDDIGTLSALHQSLEVSNRTPQFLTNSGIYETAGDPTGLHVQRGFELSPLNLNNARGNFFLKPNGVFYIHNDKANVVTSEAFQSSGIKPTLAVQSGPFYDNGKHPKLKSPSKSKKMRNGVGITATGRVVFVASVAGQERLPSLKAFGHAMHSFGAVRSIYLDGNISRVSVAGLPPEYQPVPFVGMLAVTKAAQ